MGRASMPESGVHSLFPDQLLQMVCLHRTELEERQGTEEKVNPVSMATEVGNRRPRSMSPQRARQCVVAAERERGAAESTEMPSQTGPA